MRITFFSLMATGQNLQYGGRALFPLFIYLYNICTDFLLNMKDELTSGMPENTEVILFACFSIWGFFFFFLIIKVEFSGTALK